MPHFSTGVYIEPERPSAPEGPQPAAGFPPHHLDDLRKSGLTIETVLAAGIRAADAAEVRRITGVDAGPGLVFPYPGTQRPDGRPFERVKLDRPMVYPDGRAAKYLSPVRKLNPAGNRLYIPSTLPAGIIEDPSRPLLVTEGEKKALAAIQAGFPTLGIAGVWSWKTRDEHHDSRAIDDFARIAWRGRPVGIVFDSDAVIKEGVLAAEQALKRELQRRGARPFVVRLPEPTPAEVRTIGPRFGLDDFLVVRGRDAFAKLVEEARVRLPLGCRSLAAILAESDEPLQWLVEGIWPCGACGFFAGEPKSKKSFVSNHLAISVARGVPFLGNAVVPGRVVIIDEENDRNALKSRLRRTAAGLGVDPAIEDIYIAEPSLFRLDEDHAVEEMDDLLDQLKPSLVILDPLVRLHGGDENDTSTMSRLLGRLKRLRVKHKSAFVVVHHLRKKNDVKTSLGQRMRGSSDLHGWLDCAIYFEALDGDRIRVSFESRYALPAEPMILRPLDSPDSISWQVVAADPDPATPDDIEAAILAAVAGASDGLDRQGVRAVTGFPEKKVSAAVRSLRDQGRLRVEMRQTGGKRREVFHRADGSRTSSPPPIGGGGEAKKFSSPHESGSNAPGRGVGDVPAGPTPDTLQNFFAAGSPPYRGGEEVSGGQGGHDQARNDRPRRTDEGCPYREVGGEAAQNAELP